MNSGTLSPGESLCVLHSLEYTLGDVLALLEVDQTTVGSRPERSQILLHLSQLSLEFIDPIGGGWIDVPTLDALDDRGRRAKDEHENGQRDKKTHANPSLLMLPRILY